MINKKAQNVTEYAIIVGIVSAALILMSTYFQRSIRVVVKEPVDHLGGFDSGLITAQRIQELGIESGLDPVFFPAQPYYSRSRFRNREDTYLRAGGERTKRIFNTTTTDAGAGTRQYRRIRYDQISDD